MPQLVLTCSPLFYFFIFLFYRKSNWPEHLAFIKSRCSCISETMRVYVLVKVPLNGNPYSCTFLLLTFVTFLNLCHFVPHSQPLVKTPQWLPKRAPHLTRIFLHRNYIKTEHVVHCEDYLYIYIESQFSLLLLPRNILL